MIDYKGFRIYGVNDPRLYSLELMGINVKAQDRLDNLKIDIDANPDGNMYELIGKTGCGSDSMFIVNYSGGLFNFRFIAMPISGMYLQRVGRFKRAHEAATNGPINNMQLIMDNITEIIKERDELRKEVDSLRRGVTR